MLANERFPTSPRTSVIMAHPSAVSAIDGMRTPGAISRGAAPRAAPVPGGSPPVNGGAPVPVSNVPTTAACIDVSRCCPRPERSRSLSAMIVSAAACAAPWNAACGYPIGIGGRSPLPWNPRSPAAASTVRSVAGVAACGPVCPNGVTET